MAAPVALTHHGRPAQSFAQRAVRTHSRGPQRKLMAAGARHVRTVDGHRRRRGGPTRRRVKTHPAPVRVSRCQRRVLNGGAIAGALIAKLQPRSPVCPRAISASTRSSSRATTARSMTFASVKARTPIVSSRSSTTSWMCSRDSRSADSRSRSWTGREAGSPRRPGLRRTPFARLSPRARRVARRTSRRFAGHRCRAPSASFHDALQ
jgi:hypothetical protein